MKKGKGLNRKGMTLIELLVVLVISGMLVGGMYQLFTAQSRAYTHQDQVVDVQQSIRGAMGVLLRDLRMTGYDDDRTPGVLVSTPVLIPEDNAFTTSYECNNVVRQVRYFVDGASRLIRQQTENATTTTDPLLENMVSLNIGYGVDEDGDGAMDDRNGNGLADDWISSGTVGTLKVMAARVTLTARPEQVNPGLQASPRTLVSSVTFRNMALIH
jgi:prepilin-type N-terminal cleavage/methylation domain-containing protein